MTMCSGRHARLVCECVHTWTLPFLSLCVCTGMTVLMTSSPPPPPHHHHPSRPADQWRLSQRTSWPVESRDKLLRRERERQRDTERDRERDPRSPFIHFLFPMGHCVPVWVRWLPPSITHRWAGVTTPDRQWLHWPACSCALHLGPIGSKRTTVSGCLEAEV